MKRRTKSLWSVIIVFTVLTSVLTTSFTRSNFEIAKNLDIFYTLYRELNLFYVDETDPGKLMKVAIDGMLESCDPYTTFYPESDIEDYRFMTTGQYGGIGALIHRFEDKIYISDPYVDYPAHKAGLRAGDQILSIDGNTTEGKTIDDISGFLKGQPNTQLNVDVLKYGATEPETIEVTREKVTISSVPYHGVIGQGIGYIKLTGFTQGAANEVKEAFVDLKDNHQITSLVLDLRDNPGGLLVESVNIVNLFVEKGREIVSTRGKVKQWNHVYKANSQPVDKQIPIVVLVSSGSASASEIVSGAIQDLDRGVVIGQRTFGKGLVQTTRDLTYNTKLKVTTAKYYTPSGRCIQALDYSHRKEDGSVGKVPDSLITKFATLNGREVLDGGGVLPDVVIDQPYYGQVLYALTRNYIIFNYACEYVLKHDEIAPANEFTLSDTDYDDFVAFAEKHEFSYQTPQEQKLEELIEISKEEKIYEKEKAKFDAMAKAISHNIHDDLYRFKPEISRFLSVEIANRYYFQKGRIEASLSNDTEVEEAKLILKNPEKYASILSGTKSE